MIDFDKPVRCRNGKPVRILCTDKLGTYSVVGLIKNKNGTERVDTWTELGRFCVSGQVSDRDLENY